MKLSIPSKIYSKIQKDVVLVVSPDIEHIFEIDGLAADIWQALPTMNTREELIEHFSDSVIEDMTEPEFILNVNKLIDELISLGLIIEG